MIHRCKLALGVLWIAGGELLVAAL